MNVPPNPSNDFTLTFVDYSPNAFFPTPIFDATLKDGYARTKTDKLDSKNTPAAGHPILYYSTDINP
jgi:hypothetical protein